MSKYQEAKNYYFKIYIENHLGMLARHYIDILQEAVEKAEKYDEKETPKKIIIKKYYGFNVGDYYCPHCNCKINEEFEPKYCSECGQTLDWRNE